uniref:Uncharacterized protein n=2 Tax=Oryza sativa subsp. japonica TaxID=39947 RepID=Q10EY1_ORYSJ|nr:hypothetical protein [Oryza sativa Japonica Group]ABF98284.1 hypothetical protein LOC_Os03g48400 [Oryza sativa Japonica Group]
MERMGNINHLCPTEHYFNLTSWIIMHRIFEDRCSNEDQVGVCQSVIDHLTHKTYVGLKDLANLYAQQAD